MITFWIHEHRPLRKAASSLVGKIYIYVLNNHNISVIWIQWYNSNLSCAGWWSKSYSAVLQRSFCKSDELREAIGPCSLNRSIGSNRNGPYTARVPLSGCVRGCTLPSALVQCWWTTKKNIVKDGTNYLDAGSWNHINSHQTILKFKDIKTIQTAIHHF